MWEKMNKGVSNKTVKHVSNKRRCSTMSNTSQKLNDVRMFSLFAVLYGIVYIIGD